MSISSPLAPARWILAGSMLVGAAAPITTFREPVQHAAPFSTPEHRDLTRIQHRFASGRPARIVWQGVTQIVNSPRITPEGVTWLAPSAAGLDTPPAPTMVHWTEIERLQTRGSAAGIGAVYGAIVVGGLAMAVGFSIASDPFFQGDEAGVLALAAGGALFGAGVGALVGAAIPKWVNVHVGGPAR
jgi:hypothetical protein